MSRSWSLRGRLQRRVLLGVGLSWGIGLALAVGALKHEMGELVDKSLLATGQFVLSVYRETGAVPDVGQTADIKIRVLDGGREIQGGDWAVLPEDGGHDVPGWRVIRLSDPDSAVTVEVGQNDKWRRDELAESVLWLVAIMLPVLLIVLFAISRVVASVMRPADRFARTLETRKPGDMTPIDAPRLPREMAPIRDSVNFYLDRTRAHVEAETQFAVHAAHELRTPVAAASAQAQALAAGVADPAAAQRIVESLQRLGELVDRLLQLSRADAAGASPARSDLVQITRMVIADTRGDIVFDDGDVDSALVSIQPEALALILSNLLRNARDHGTGRVRVTLEEGPILTITNPTGADAAFRHGTFEKSARSSGTGLGLGIVQKIAGKDGIELSFAIENAIAKVVLRFPAAAAA